MRTYHLRNDDVKSLKACCDPKDDMFLKSAVNGSATCLVSSDKEEEKLSQMPPRRSTFLQKDRAIIYKIVLKLIGFNKAKEFIIYQN